MRINYRNIVRNENNVIVSGSATLDNNTYKPNEKGNHKGNHSKREVVERLGKVLWIDPEDQMKGIFNSPTRGLVHYDLSRDCFTEVSPNDERLAGVRIKKEEICLHASFGSTYLFFSELCKTPLMSVLRQSFGENNRLYQKVLAHVAHDCLKINDSIKCGDFLKQDMLSGILADLSCNELNADYPYFQEMAADDLRTRFFKALVTEMRKKDPEFGQGCYADSLPLPDGSSDNPFNALSAQGTDGVQIPARLALVLDIRTNIPLWFEIIPANTLNERILQSVSSKVKEALDVTISSFALGAGYARKELFQEFNRNSFAAKDKNGIIRERTLLAGMPASAPYPHHELYETCKPDISNVEYLFDHEHHTFFGKRVAITLFDQPEYAYVYVDKTQADNLIRNWREDHWEEWTGLTYSQKEWYQVMHGFFVLIGNREAPPKEALRDYRNRVRTESYLHDTRAYLKTLPPEQWNKETVKGKIFHDVIETIMYRAFEKSVAPANMTMSELNANLGGWGCLRKAADTLLELDTPGFRAEEALNRLGYVIPGRIDSEDLRQAIFAGIPMSKIPVTQRKKRYTAKESRALSPEAQREIQEMENRNLLIKNAENTMKKAVAKAEKQFLKAEEKARAARDKALKTAQERIAKLRDSYDRKEVAAKDCDKVMAEMADMTDAARKACEKNLEIAKEILANAKREALAEYEQTVKAAGPQHN